MPCISRDLLCHVSTSPARIAGICHVDSLERLLRPGGTYSIRASSNLEVDSRKKCCSPYMDANEPLLNGFPRGIQMRRVSEWLPETSLEITLPPTNKRNNSKNGCGQKTYTKRSPMELPAMGPLAPAGNVAT